MSLSAAVLAHYTSSALLFHYSSPNAKKGIYDQAKLIASKAKFLKSRVGEREKLKGDFGSWYLVRTTQTMLCAACVSDDYPERVAYALLQKLQAIVQQKPPKDDESERKIKGLNKQMTALCEKYKDACVDKVKEAQRAADQLKQELNKGVRNLIGNKQNLDEINDKASLMKDYAKSFEKNSSELQKVMCCRKYKFFVVIGVGLVMTFVAAGLVVYLQSH